MNGDGDSEHVRIYFCYHTYFKQTKKSKPNNSNSQGAINHSSIEPRPLIPLKEIFKARIVYVLLMALIYFMLKLVACLCHETAI